MRNLLFITIANVVMCAFVGQSYAQTPVTIGCGAVATPSDPHCLRSNGSISIVAPSGTTYQWNANANNATTALVTNLGAATYFVTITNASSSCVASASITLTNQGIPPNITVFGVNPTCGQNNGTIQANNVPAGAAVVWSSNVGSAQSTQAHVTGLAAGIYIVTVTSNGCADTTQTLLTNQTAPPVVTIATTAPSCGMNNGVLQATVSPSTPPATLLWSVNAGGGSAATVTGLGAGTYTVTATTNGCTATASEVFIGSQPIVIASQIVTPLCANGTNGSVTAIPNGNMGSTYTYLWALHQQITSTLSNISAGTYIVTVTEQPTGCTAKATFMVADGSSPVANAGGDVTLIKGKGTTLTAAYIAGDQYSWVGSDGTNQQGNTFAVVPTATTTYTVLVVDARGCTATDEVTVVVEDTPSVVFANVFTPNGDNLNDTFFVHITGNIEIKNFRIVNRWGNLVHNSIKPWDGTTDGVAQPAGAYLYFVELSINGNLEQRSGDVELLR